MGKKNSLSAFLVLLITAITLLYGGYLSNNASIYNKQIAVFSQSKVPSGFIRPQVVDGFSEKPIKGAIIVIPELKESFETDEQGLAPNIKIPILEDQHFESINPKTWGETTLIVYKEGYHEYVLFYVHVWENQNRQGPKVLLFPKQEMEIDQPMSIVEGPHRLWVNSLVEKYRP